MKWMLITSYRKLHNLCLFTTTIKENIKTYSKTELTENENKKKLLHQDMFTSIARLL